ncbi:helix-turn-helix domain-containing protein [Streptomyces iakyrus]|uniref:helix-turn-helix domain-containing protein n=1 Tax=Streptomyces iakyrus TaxID=68219 RepID=UPI003D916DA6
MTTSTNAAEEPADGSSLAELASALHQLFLKLGCSQREFSARLYLDHTGVSRYLRGERVPPFTFVEALLREVEGKTGAPLAVELKEQLLSLHRQAMQERDGWSAFLKMAQRDMAVLRQDRDAAVFRAEQAETQLQLRELGSSEHRWSAFTAFMTEREVSAEAMAMLEGVCTRAVACLPAPTAERAQQTVGVVDAPVGSGKMMMTAGITARALDAGYRLVIVLSGSMNALRAQVQQRLDEALEQDRLPLLRLTDSASDFQVPFGPAALSFEKTDPNLPMHDPRNLHHSTPRLLVIKQHPRVLRKLRDSLQRLVGPLLEELPALILDTEPTSPNLDPLKSENTVTGQLRSQIVTLLPRAQLIRFEHTPAPTQNRFVFDLSDSLWDRTPDFIIPARLRVSD